MHKRSWLALVLVWLLLFPSLSSAQQVQYTADFEYMRHYASNVAGWLYQPDTTIDSPILYTQDRSFYLRRGYDNRYSETGAVYMLSEEMPDLSAPLIILRGRNNLDDRLFGSLSLYQEPAYYTRHPTLYLVSPKGNYQLDIFAGVKTRHKDHDSWQAADLPAILENSFLTPDPAFLPQEDDAWAILTTEHAQNEGSRFVIYARKRPIPQSDAPTVWLNEQEMDKHESLNGYAAAEGVGTWMLYGQNDPLWNQMLFEADNSGLRRVFGDGGCGPTSIAMAIANLVPAEKLPKLNDYATHPMGYVFCPCCIGDRRCKQAHVPYRLQTPEQFLRYLPLAVGSFAMGNNTFGVQGRQDGYGTSMRYLDAICSVYGISTRTADTLEEALPYLRRKDTMAVCCASGYYTPFTNSSHFLVLASVTNEYIYVLDPLRRETYGDMDRRGIAEIITPGLVRVRLENADLCHFTSIQLLTY